jgi:anti-sigma-K factor RskA
VNNEQYISSGIIESYVMGLANEQEAAEFENLCSANAELLEARIAFEEGLEKNAMLNAVLPPAALKDRIWKAIQEDMKSQPAKVVSLDTVHTRRTAFMTGKRWAIAASFLAVCLTGYFVYNNYHRNQLLNEQLASNRARLERMDTRTKNIEEQLLQNNQKMKQVKLIVPSQPTKATMNVFWDSTSTNVYLVVRDMTPLPQGQQYQLWAVNKGKYTSLGLFDAPEDQKLILKMNNVQEADSFAITVTPIQK